MYVHNYEISEEISLDEHLYFYPAPHQERYPRNQMSTFNIFTLPPQAPQKRPLLTISLPVTVASQFASLSPLALSSSIPHALLLPAASCTFWSPTWLILETSRCPKQETAATLILLLMYPVSMDR